MIWIILVVVLALVISGLFLFFKNIRKVESREAQGVVRWSIGTIVGGIAGVIIGILLVEFAGYEYPLPVVFWFGGMAIGQLSGILYNKYKKEESTA